MHSTHRWRSVREVVFSLIPVLASSAPTPAQEAPFGVTPTWGSFFANPTHAVALGDVDGDGDLDLTCGNYGYENTLYLNDGTTFAERHTWSSDFTNSTFIAALGDVDGDGDLDVVYGNHAQSNTLYLNEGGTFATAPAWSSNSTNSTRAVALGDVDGDGDLDLACGNGASGQRNTLYLNAGGTFTTTPTWISDLTNATFAIALGDVDRDGDLDLVCGNFGQSNTLYINEKGTFGTTPAWSSGLANFTDAVALGDIDGDGDLDLACGNWGRQCNTVYLNEGGVFATEPTWSSDSCYTTLAVALGDVDGDGDLDLACGNDAAGVNTLYLNVGGSLSTTPVWFSGLANQTTAVALGDVDGDGDLDLTCGNDARSNTLYLNETGALSNAPAWSSGAANQTEAVALGDVDGDGDLDLVCGNSFLESNTLYLSEGGTFAANPLWSSTPANRTNAIALGDVDGDGDLDLACGNFGWSNTLYSNEGDIFTTTPTWSSRPTARTFAVALGDVDGNGYLDLACGNDPQSNTLYLNEGGAFASTPTWLSDPKSATRAVALGDINGDGNLDLVCGNLGQSNTLYLGGGGVLSTTPEWFSFDTNQTEAIGLGDIDGDGDLDLACGNFEQKNTLYFNEGGTFSATPGWYSGHTFRTVALELRDVDGDGDLDLVCGNMDENNTLYVNDGRTLATEEVWSSESRRTRALAMGDLDGDGDLDLACGTRGANTLYRGLKNPVFKGDPTTPTNHLPNNAAHLRRVSVTPISTEPNLRMVEASVVDVESDSVWILPEYQYEGEPVWTPAAIGGQGGTIGPLESSPGGVIHALPWDISLLPFDSRRATLRLRTISHPSTSGLIQHVAAYQLEMGFISPARPGIRSSASALTFPTVTVGDTVSVPLALSNDGSEVLSVGDAALPLSRPFPFDIGPGTTDSLVVFLQPLTHQGVPEDLQIVSNDPTTPILSIPLTTDVRDLQVETITLSSEEEVPLGEALIIQVVPAEGVRVESGTLFHRAAGGGVFTPVELVPVGGAFVGVVPSTSVTEVGLEYYVEVENSPIVRVDPPGAPGDSLFFQAVASPSSVTAVPQAGSGGRFLKDQDIPIVVQLQSGIVFVEGSLHYRRAGELGYQAAPLIETEGGPAASIPAAFVEARGVEYWVDVVTQTNPRITDPASDPRTAPRVIRTSVLSEEEATSSPGRRYRMLSVPLEFDPEFEGTLEDILRDEDEFGPSDVAIWRAFRHVSPSGPVELADDPRFRPEPGRAFWLISSTEHRVDSAPTEALSTPSDREFEIVLMPEWNQFGCPFAFPVKWDDVRVSSDAVGDPVAFDPSLGTAGNYAEEPPSVLVPFQGYFIKNTSSHAETLWIPPIESTDVAARTGPTASALPEWSLRLEAASPAAQAAMVILGVHPGADRELDSLDRETPPSPPGSWVQLAIDNRHWGRQPGRYRRDLREGGAEGHIWNITLRTDVRGDDVTVATTLDRDLPSTWQLRLIDVEQRVRTDLSTESDYRLVSFGPNREYRLAVIAGTAEYLSHMGRSLATVPGALSLGTNAPNPFGSATRIRFGLPREQQVTLGIYDLQGRRVVTLVENRRLPAGFHSEVWQGRDQSGRSVASGVYFYRLRSEDGLLTRKLLVVR